MLTPLQLTGRNEEHLEWDEAGVGLHPDCRRAFEQLRQAAAGSGFDLRIASGFRSFERQLAIWNDKARGARLVHDDEGAAVELALLPELERVYAILRYSALPGGSRHHWGTDLDIYDAAAMPTGYQLQLTPQEFSDDGMFGPLHAWLEQQLASAAAVFYRPYAEDRGGVAPERWHLSYRPLATDCQRGMSPGLLLETLAGCDMALVETVQQNLSAIYRRFIAPLGE